MSLALRYLAAELARAYLLVGAALLVLFDLIAFLTESEDIGDARYDLFDAIVVIAYSTPALLVDLAPFTAFLATLYAFVVLDAKSEITALRAAGVSRRWLARAGALVGLAFVILMALVEIVARPLHVEASLLRMYETAKSGNPLKGSGFWTRSDGMVVNVESLEGASRPGHVRIYNFGAGGLLESYQVAGSADVRDAGHWRLNDVRVKRYAGTAPVELKTLDHEAWSPVWALETDIYSLSATSLSIPDLVRRVDTDQEHASERTELWRRLALPVSAIAYGILAVAFALGGTARGGKGVRVAIGAASALVIYLAEQLLVNVGILAGLPIALVSFVPSLLVLALASWLIRRT